MTGSSLAAALLAELDEQALDELAARLAPRLAERILPAEPLADRWLDTKQAAGYVGMTVPAFQKHASAREMAFEQECPGGKRWFKRAELDAWRCGASRRFG